MIEKFYQTYLIEVLFTYSLCYEIVYADAYLQLWLLLKQMRTTESVTAAATASRLPIRWVIRINDYKVKLKTFTKWKEGINIYDCYSAHQAQEQEFIMELPSMISAAGLLAPSTSTFSPSLVSNLHKRKQSQFEFFFHIHLLSVAHWLVIFIKGNNVKLHFFPHASSVPHCT